MSTLSLRLPDSFHQRLRELAAEEQVSINQLITLAIAEKLSALDTVRFLEKRAARAERTDFDAVLDRVADVPTPAEDALPE
jgi:predicted DNA-binding ribbon-helix-helix protein